jgi:hypothetical protein
MRHEYCTLFDSNYLFKAVAMLRSLLRHPTSSHLTAFCFDKVAKETIDQLDLPDVSTVSLPQLEAYDRDLLSVKHDRNPTEYCWTATPSLLLHMFENRPDLNEVTYLDADLLFFADPQPLFDEMGDASILITPHRFAEEYKWMAKFGIYNVQFVTFRRNESAMTCLRWWRERCLEWCYRRVENGRFGDQKYLDDWTERFQGVHVLRHRGGGLAPWNITQYRVHELGGRVMVDEDPLIFFHYHDVKLRKRGRHDCAPPGFVISAENRRLVYDPYFDALDGAVGEVRSVVRDFSEGLVPGPSLRDRGRTLRGSVGTLARRRFPRLMRVLRGPERS